MFGSIRRIAQALETLTQVALESEKMRRLELADDAARSDRMESFVLSLQQQQREFMAQWEERAKANDARDVEHNHECRQWHRRVMEHVGLSVDSSDGPVN